MENKGFENLFKSVSNSDGFKELLNKLKNVKEHNKDLFESEAFGELYEEISAMMGKEVKPRILMIGKTGVGKSSVLNALFGRSVFNIGVTPTTMEFDEQIWHTAKGDIIAIDAPGFSDPSKDANIAGVNYDDAILDFAEKSGAHMALLVIKSDDRALEPECQFLRKWYQRENLRTFPIITVINQIDKMDPVQVWKPETINLANPITKKSKNIRTYMDWVFSLDEFRALNMSDRIVAFAAPNPDPEDEEEEPRAPYNVELLKHKIYELLPVAAKTLFARAAKMQYEEGERLVNYYAGGAAAAVLANPLPGSDFLSISAVQVAMTIHLGRLYNMEMTKQFAVSLLTPVLNSFAGRFLAQTIISWIPGAKNFVGSPLAFGLTKVVGMSILAILSSGRSMEQITAEDIQNASKNIDFIECAKEYNSQEKA